VATFLGQHVDYVNEIVALTDNHVTMRSLRSHAGGLGQLLGGLQASLEDT
jgi:hypothetical protein